MTRSADHFDAFEPHTRLKHLVLATYLAAWARKLLLRKGAGDTVFYVDACAGRGMDDAGNRGSPVLAAREAAMIEGQLREDFGRDVHVIVIAIEKNAAHFKALQRNLAPFGNRARALHGTAEEIFPALLLEMGDAPALIFIDPFGMEPLKADIVYRALDRPRTEVFLLFADQAALRHYGVMTADADESPAEGQFMLGIELDDAPPISDLEKDAKRDDLVSTRDRCEAIMNDAFGGTYWKAVVDAAAPSQRRAAVLSCYRELLHDARARFVLQIPIRTASNRHLYHLFHATRSAHGYVAMKEAVDYAFKHGPIAGSAAAVMRFLVHSDMNAIERRVREVFAGKTIHWTGDKLDKAAPSLRRFVLEETPAFPSELPALKARLAAFRDPGFRRTLVYSFPVDVVG